MAQQYDVSLKSLFMRPGTGIIRGQVFGGKVVRFLPTEQPQVSNRRVDLLVLNNRRRIVQIEFQSTNQRRYGFRMLRDYVYFTDRHRQEIKQVTIYIGRAPLRMAPVYNGEETTHKFRITNLREWEAAPLLASPDWVDNVLGVVAKGDHAVAFESVLAKVRSFPRDDRRQALGELLLVSGILKMEAEFERKVQEFHMTIDLRKNSIAGPMIAQAEAKGLAKGLAKGRLQGLREILTRQLEQKFGSRLPGWATKRLQSASEEKLDRWATSVLTANTLKDALS